MARPIKHNADYFSHDADMRNDQKINAVRNCFGLEGYAIWNMILEVLTDKDYFEYPWNDLEVELLASDFRITPEKLTGVVDYCLKLGLLSVVDGLLYSNNHRKRFDALLTKRNRDRDQKGEELNNENPVIADENPVIADESTQSKEEYSKQDFTIKEKEKALTHAKSKDERESEFREATLKFIGTYPEKMLEDFTRYWTESKPNGAKLRFELQPTFDISRRLITWSGKDFNQNKGQAGHPAVIHISDENTDIQLKRFKA